MIVKKFRAWDRHNKRMSWSFGLGQTKLTFDTKPGYCEEVKIYDLSIEELQYTGLKDKSGKEIYEVDILLAEYGSHNEMLSYFVVQMIDGCWGAVIYYDFPIENDCFYWRYVNEFNDHEVIGNIYENPELLGDSK